HEDTKYAIGSVLNHVLLHQTIIGLEAIKQLESVDEYPDLIVGCVGGGSSFSGLFWPFYEQKVSKKAPKDVEFLAVEPTACPSLTKGIYMYDHGETARLTPLLKMYTLGHTFIPPRIHAGGLRYHGAAPTLCLLIDKGYVKATAYDQVSVFEAASLFTRTEGILPAPEPAHSIKAVIDEALKCKEKGEEKTILFLLCGHGYFDMNAYNEYLEGKLQPCDFPKDEVEKSINYLKELYPWIDKLPY
ncbi:MAG: pyridoxal-phosphate dependent enzyme, partial [Nitrososphaerales archaeon]|nr:pyridoxal-phosphate dependent enzyme [Nitrososphaerales archaeon]